MKKRFGYLLLSVLCLSFAIPLHAEVIYRFELYGAANSILTDKDFEIRPPQFVDITDEGYTHWDGKYRSFDGMRGGVRFGTDGKEYWGQEFSYSYGHNTAQINVYFPVSYHMPPLNIADFKFGFTSRTHRFAYNVLLYPAGLSRKKVYPYVTAGAGATIFTVSGPAKRAFEDLGFDKLRNQTSFTFNVGGGIRYQFTRHWGIRLDLRDWMSHAPRYGLPKSSDNEDAMVLPVEGIFHQFESSFGLVFCF